MSLRELNNNTGYFREIFLTTRIMRCRLRPSQLYRLIQSVNDAPEWVLRSAITSALQIDEENEPIFSSRSTERGCAA